MKKLILSVMVVFIFTVDAMSAEKRIALVIGNASYPEVGELLNPVNDAELMASTLTDLGFEVTKELDISLQQMKRAIRTFGHKLDDAGEDGVGLFYYAGHGLQLDGSNYIIPVDAAIERRGDVEIEAFNMSAVLSMMEYSRSRLNFVILDACRNNPYTRGFRSVTRGLAQMGSPTGSLVAYSTSPGSLAADGDDLNSPYTQELANAMRLEGVEVEKMFRIVRNNVRKLTNNLQTPWESSSLIGDSFYFNETDSTASVEQEIPTPSKAEIKETINLELEFWNAVEDSSEQFKIQAYIDKFPTGYFVDLAKLRLESLQRAQENAAAKAEELVKAEELANAEELAKTEELTKAEQLAVINEPEMTNEKLKMAAIDPDRPYDGRWWGSLHCSKTKSGSWGPIVRSVTLEINGNQVLMSGDRNLGNGTQKGKIALKDGLFKKSGKIRIVGRGIHSDGTSSNFSYSGEFNSEVINLKGVRGSRNCTIKVTRFN